MSFSVSVFTVDSVTQQKLFGHFLSWILCPYLKYAFHLTDYYGVWKYSTTLCSSTVPNFNGIGQGAWKLWVRNSLIPFKYSVTAIEPIFTKRMLV